MADLDTLISGMISSLNPKKSHNTVLDIGCGDGSFAIKFLKPKTLVGLDKNLCVRKHFLKNVEAANINGIFKGNEPLKSLKKNFFDMIISVGVFELNDDDEISRIVKDSKMLLKRQGVFIALYYPWSMMSPIYLPVILKEGREAYEKKINVTVNDINIKKLRKIFQKSGFEVLRLGGFNPYPSYFWRSDRLHRSIFFSEKLYLSCFFGGRFLIARSK